MTLLEKNADTIKRFNKISIKYIKRVKHCKVAEEFEDISIQYVLDLNKLNDQYDGELIETDQRELIVPMIFDLAKEQNIDIEDDFTLEYRDW